MFILDLLDNLPRLRLSTDHFKVILWALRELGMRSVPSMARFRKMQQSLQRQCAIRTDLKHSPEGNIFYQNRIADLIALVRCSALLTLSTIRFTDRLQGLCQSKCTPTHRNLSNTNQEDQRIHAFQAPCSRP